MLNNSRRTADFEGIWSSEKSVGLFVMKLNKLSNIIYVRYVDIFYIYFANQKASIWEY